MRHAATFALGLAAGVLLALLLTSNATSRQSSAPRPAATILATLRPVAPLRTGAPNGSIVGLSMPYPTGTPSPAVAASPTPRPSAEPAPLGSPRAGGRPALSTPGATLRGRASWVRASLGSAYLAARLPKGTRLRICGPAGCIRGIVNDFGPSKRVHPNRIVDLSAADFTAVCGPLSMGVCEVRMTK